MSDESMNPFPLIIPVVSAHRLTTRMSPFMILCTFQFITNSLNWMGLGFLLIQVYYYFDNFPSDKVKVRILIGILLPLELFQTAATTHRAWAATVTEWGSASVQTSHPWSAAAVPFIDGVLGWVVQSFYAWRIWVLAPNMLMKAFSVLILLLSVAQCVVVGIASVIYSTNLTLAELTKLGNEYTAYASMGFVADVLIAIGMFIVLRSGHNEALWSKTDNIIKRLTIMTIGTGSLLAVFSLASIMLFKTAEGRASLQYIPVSYMLGKLYSNSAMVTLNARKSLRRTLLGTTARTGDDNIHSMPLQFRHTSPTRKEYDSRLGSNTNQSTKGHDIPVVLDGLDPTEEAVISRSSKPIAV